MKAVPFKETQKFKLGRTGEKLVSEILQEKGWHVIPSYDYSGDENNKAPKLQGIRSSFILPDLDVSKNGKRFWIEVKTKSQASYTRITGQFEHGIPTKHFRHYQKIQEITGTKVGLCIYEINTGNILGENLDRLENVCRFYDGG